MIYLDYNATTPLSDGVKKSIIENLDNFYNPSSIYSESKKMLQKIQEARKDIAELIRAFPEQIIFTGCSTESNNSVINHCVLNSKIDTPHIIVSSVEHPAILTAAEYYNKIRDVKMTVIPVDAKGNIDIDDICFAITEDTVLVSVMLANNEIGNIYPVASIAKKVHSVNNNIMVHTDATQAIGKMRVDVNELEVDFLTFSGHKFYAPKGVGGLYVRNPEDFMPFIYGGHQEKEKRAGTENTISIIAMGQAAREAAYEEREDKIFHQIKSMRDRAEDVILKRIPGCHVLGDKNNRICNTSCICFDGLNGIEICMLMNNLDFCISSGSACNSITLSPSHVMKAMGINAIPIRMSIGKYTTQEEIDKFCKALQITINKLKKMKGMI